MLWSKFVHSGKKDSMKYFNFSGTCTAPMRWIDPWKIRRNKIFARELLLCIYPHLLLYLSLFTGSLDSRMHNSFKILIKLEEVIDQRNKLGLSCVKLKADLGWIEDKVAFLLDKKTKV